MAEIEVTNFFPTELTKNSNWIYWRKERTTKGKPTKVPYSPNYKGGASVTNKKTWSTFEYANNNIKQYQLVVDGLGYVFDSKHDLIFVDIDHCFYVDGTLTEIGKYALDLFKHKTYCEISQSGNGLHFIVKGTIPRGFKNSNAGVEMYAHDRYCAITFNAICPVEPSEMQSELDELFEKFKTEKKEKKKAAPEERPQSVFLYSDATIVEKACRSEKFRELYYLGNSSQIYPSDSEADLFMCKELAFWTDRDADAIFRIIRNSCMYRDKWERNDYRSNTIQKAIDSLTESLSEFVKRKEADKLNELQKYIVSEARAD